MDTVVDTERQEGEAVEDVVTAAPDAPEIVAEPKEVVAEREAPRRNVRGRGGRAPRARAPRERSEFDQVTIDVRRVARVMAGGRRFNFSLTLVIGDKNGRVGVGIGKATDTALAVDKATRDAKKHLTAVARTKGGSIAHGVSAKFSSSTIEIIPSPGRGLVAGSAMRTVLELAGVTDVVAKIHTRSKNKLTIARATVAALKKLSA